MSKAIRLLNYLLSYLPRHGQLFDFGAIFGISFALLLGWQFYVANYLHELNQSQVQIPVETIALEGRNSADIEASMLKSVQIVWKLPDSALVNSYRNIYLGELVKFYASSPDINISNETTAQSDRGLTKFSTPFSIAVNDKKVVYKLHIVSATTPSYVSGKLQIDLKGSTLVIDGVYGLRPWNIKSATSQLQKYLSDVSGNLGSSGQWVEESPFAFDNANWAQGFTIPHPFLKGAIKEITLPKVTINDSAVLASNGGITSLLSTEISGNSASHSISTTSSFNLLLKSVLNELPAKTNEDYLKNGIAYLPEFLKELASVSIEPIYARDRIRQALSQSIDILSKDYKPVFALEISSTSLQEQGRAELLRALERVGTANPNLQITWGTVEVRPQNLYVEAQATLKIPEVLGVVRFKFAAIGTIAGRNDGVDLIGALENLSIVSVDLPGNPDLSNMLHIINDALAEAIGLGNWFIKPSSVVLDPILPGPIDLTNIPGATSNPSSINFPTQYWNGIVALMDGNHIALMASLTSTIPPAFTPTSPTKGLDELWADFHGKFDQSWNEQFGNTPMVGDARALLKTSYVASLINNTWNAANPTISATNSSKLIPTPSIPFIPTVENPGAFCDLDCDKKYCTTKFGITFCLPVLYESCRGTKVSCEAIAGAINISSDIFKGSMDLDLAWDAKATINNTNLALSENLDGMLFSYQAHGDAYFKGTLYNRPRNVSYLACPTELAVAFPLDGSPLHLSIPQQETGLSGTLSWTQTGEQSSGTVLTLKASMDTMIKGNLDPTPVTALVPIISAISWACPINESAFLASSVAGMAGLIHLQGSVKFDPTSRLADDLLTQHVGQYRTITEGSIEQVFHIDAETNFKLPQINVAGEIYKSTASVANGLIMLDLKHDIAEEHYSAGVSTQVDYLSATARLGIEYPLLGAFVASSIQEGLKTLPEVKSSSVDVKAIGNPTFGDQADFLTSLKADLRLRFTKQDAENLIGKPLLDVALSKGWVLPEKDPSGHLVAILVPTQGECKFQLGLAAPIASFDSATIELRKPSDPFKDCTLSGDVAKVIDLRSNLTNLLNGIFNTIPQGLLKLKLSELFPDDKGTSPIDQLLASMPFLSAMKDEINLGTTQCSNNGNPAFCFEVRFPQTTGPCDDISQKNTFTCLMQSFRDRAPSSSSAAIGIPDSLVGQWVAPPRAFGCSYLDASKGLYPSKTADGSSCDDGDMTLFAGLLCSSGENEIAKSGCKEVLQSQSASGQWWRSPNLVGKSFGASDFSGDMSLGVLLYAATSKDANGFKVWRDYILSNPVKLPQDSINNLKLFRTCTRESEGSCRLLAENWFFINAVSNKLGIPSVEDPEMASSYGHSSKWLPFLASINPDGYRLHLVAAQVYLLQKLGLSDEYTKDAARILAGRNPENPFYLWLYLGKDQKVQDLTLKYCPALDSEPHTDRTQWTWERSMDSQEAPWKKSMYWECSFMANLLEP